MVIILKFILWCFFVCWSHNVNVLEHIKHVSLTFCSSTGYTIFLSTYITLQKGTLYCSLYIQPDYHSSYRTTEIFVLFQTITPMRKLPGSQYFIKRRISLVGIHRNLQSAIPIYSYTCYFISTGRNTPQEHGKHFAHWSNFSHIEKSEA